MQQLEAIWNQIKLGNQRSSMKKHLSYGFSVKEINLKNKTIMPIIAFDIFNNFIFEIIDSAVFDIKSNYTIMHLK